jgi:DNA-binding MarR family transcriptional regulator/predicted GNAT family N-acyltransferase
MPVELAESVAAVRRFNRFYTPAIGLLKNGYLETPYTAAEGRALYEIGKGDGVTAKAIGEVTGLDAGYLSRIVARLERDGVVARERSASDGRSTLLRLTEQGADVFDAFDRRSSALVEGLIAGLSGDDRTRLVRALETVQDLLGPNARPAPEIVLREPRAGDMGWITERHAVLYGREYGWGPGIEAVTARICADYLEAEDRDRQRCWIAERDGERLGCVFMVKENEDVARLRLLMLDPAARGTGLGRRLVDESIAFARAAGYREIVLWTHQVLTAARKIYAATGFVLEEVWTHDDFGHPEVSESWRLKF